MTAAPVDQFFESVARAFARNHRALPGVEIALLVLAGLVLAVLVSRPLRQRWARWSAFRRLCAQRGLSPGDRLLAARLARQAREAPLALVTRREVFERATGLALGRAQGLAPARPLDEVAESIHRLRERMGFDRLPRSAALLGTRQLVAGTPVGVGVRSGQVADVGEMAFSVSTEAPAGLAVGELADLSMAHGREARYALRCRLLEVRPAPAGGERLVFAHDEAPTRIQERGLFRVPARGVVTLDLADRAEAPGPALRLVGSRALDPGEGQPVRGELVDLSAGGALVSSRTPIPAGLRVRASIGLGRDRFPALRAVVRSAEAGPEGEYRAHLAFRELLPADRERLVAAVTRLELSERGAAGRPA